MDQIPLLLTGTMGMYGVILLVAGFAQLNGWDLRPVGQMAIAGVILQLFMTPALLIALGAAALPTTGVAIALIIYIVLLLGFFLLVNGKLGLKPTGLVCLIASLASLWIAIGFTGAVPML